MSEGTPAIVVERLARRYGATLALSDASFRVERGETFGLIGPDGAGKTTTLKLVTGLLEPHEGRVRTLGLEPTRSGRRLARRIGYLSQRFSLYGDLSVDENVAFFAEVHGVRRWKPRRDELLEMLRLAPFRARLADRLSGGMKQKLALACHLVHTPELLVLDEPTTGVDPVSRRDFWRILSHLQRDGLTILLTTPSIDEAERCGRVALMHRGRLMVTDTPTHLREAAGGSVAEIIARPRRAAAEKLRALVGVAQVATFGERLHVPLPGVTGDEAAHRAEVLAENLRSAGIEIASARATAPSLEDVFIARIRAEEAGATEEGSP